MLRGVSFTISQTKNSSVLWKIFRCLDIDKYGWYLIEDQTEVWSDYDGGEFFDANYYDGQSFAAKIKHEHYVIFLKFQAYSHNADFSEIHTYHEFASSNCELVLLINDGIFVEIYLKNAENTKVLYQNALANEFTDVTYITADNDSRTKMNVL